MRTWGASATKIDAIFPYNDLHLLLPSSLVVAGLESFVEQAQGQASELLYSCRDVVGGCCLPITVMGQAPLVPLAPRYIKAP